MISTIKHFPPKAKACLTQSLHGISWPKWDWGPRHRDWFIFNSWHRRKFKRNIICVYLQQEFIPKLNRRLKSNLRSDQCVDSPWRQELTFPSSSSLCQDQAFMVTSLIGFEYHGTSTRGNPIGEVEFALSAWNSWSELCQRQLLVSFSRDNYSN